MSGDILLNQLTPQAHSVNVTAIVIEQASTRRTQNGTVTTLRVADSTGSINVSIMNADHNDTFNAGDILKFRGAYASIYQGGLHLAVGKNGECKKIGEFMMVFSETPNITQMPLPAGATDRRNDDRRQSQSPSGRYPRM